MATEICKIVSRALQRAGGKSGPSDSSGEDKNLRATSSCVAGSHDPKIPVDRGLLQDPKLWLQGGFQHHIPVRARGV